MRKNHWTKYRAINTKVGMILSLGLVLLAFEWKTFEPAHIVTIDYAQDFEEQQAPPPRTEHIIPPPPPKMLPKVIEIKDEDIAEELDEVVLDIEVDLDTEMPEDLIVDEVIDDEVIEDTYLLLPEDPAMPKGGMKQFLKSLGQQLEYPKKAAQMGVQGRVILEFIVDKKGRVTDIKVLRGIGAGCDEEAIRILENSPDWKPAKQRGRPVKQKITMPVFFKLQY